MRDQSPPFDLRIEERTDLAMIAVQGPEARARARRCSRRRSRRA